jgi:hypothetical protein
LFQKSFWRNYLSEKSDEEIHLVNNSKDHVCKVELGNINSREEIMSSLSMTLMVVLSSPSTIFFKFASESCSPSFPELIQSPLAENSFCENDSNSNTHNKNPPIPCIVRRRSAFSYLSFPAHHTLTRIA